MNWTFHVKEPQHWVSSPPGYFIVQEEGADGRSKYVVYRGQFKSWQRDGATNPQLERVGEFVTLKDAKSDAHFQIAK